MVASIVVVSVLLADAAQLFLMTPKKKKSFHSASLKEAAILNSELEVVETPLVFQPEILVKFLAQKIQLLGCDETHNNNNNNNNKQLQQPMR